jgi:molybdopterin converting factor subunit 1
MRVRVRLFARAKDLAGAEVIEVALEAGATVAALRCRLAEQVPALAALLERSALAVDEEIAEDARLLAPDTEVALLPPVSGGG